MPQSDRAPTLTPTMTWIVESDECRRFADALVGHERSERTIVGRRQIGSLSRGQGSLKPETRIDSIVCKKKAGKKKQWVAHNQGEGTVCDDECVNASVQVPATRLRNSLTSRSTLPSSILARTTSPCTLAVAALAAFKSYALSFASAILRASETSFCLLSAPSSCQIDTECA